MLRLDLVPLQWELPPSQRDSSYATDTEWTESA